MVATRTAVARLGWLSPCFSVAIISLESSSSYPAATQRFQSSWLVRVGKISALACAEHTRHARDRVLTVERLGKRPRTEALRKQQRVLPRLPPVPLPATRGAVATKGRR